MAARSHQRVPAARPAGPRTLARKRACRPL